MSDFDYNPLYDVHLKNYFSSPHMQKHLRKMGLISSQQGGDEVYARHQAMMEMILKNREAQLMKMAELRRKLDAAEKVGTCRRIRSGQSPESFKRIKPSRSMSRGRRDVGGDRQRRFSNSFEEKNNIVQMEEQFAPPESRRGRDAFQRLSANVKRFNYLHKMDDPTLVAYQESLRNQLDRLERFREISFGVHSIARQPPVAHGSWFFRRRSLPSLTANLSQSAPSSSLHEPLRSINNMRTRKHSTGRADSSRTSCPPPKRRDSASRLPPIATRSKSKSAASKPPVAARLPPAGNRSRSVQKKATTSSSTKKTDIILPAVAAGGIAVAAAAALAARSPSPVLPPVNQSAPSPSPPASEHHEEPAIKAFESPVDELDEHHDEDHSEPLMEHHGAERRSLSEDESEPEYAEEDQEVAHFEHHRENEAYDIPEQEEHFEGEDHERVGHSEDESHQETEAFEIPADEHHEERVVSPVDFLDEPHQPKEINEPKAFEVSADELVRHEEDQHEQEQHEERQIHISPEGFVHEEEHHEEEHQEFHRQESPVDSIHEDHHHQEEKPADAFEVSTEELVEHGAPHDEEEDYHKIHKREIEEEPMIHHHHLEHEESVPSYRGEDLHHEQSPVQEIHESEAFEVPADELVEHHQEEETHLSPEGSIHEEEHHREEIHEEEHHEEDLHHEDFQYGEEHHEEDLHHEDFQYGEEHHEVREDFHHEIEDHHEDTHEEEHQEEPHHEDFHQEEHQTEAFEIPAEELVAHEAPEESHEEIQNKEDEVHEPEAFEVPADELVEHHDEVHHSPRESPELHHSIPAEEDHSAPHSPIHHEEVHYQTEAFEIPAEELVNHGDEHIEESQPENVLHESEAFEVSTEELVDHGDHHEEEHRSSPRAPESPGHLIHSPKHDEPEAFEISTDELVHHDSETDIHYENSAQNSPVAFEIPTGDLEERHHHHSTVEIEPVEIAEQLSPNEQDEVHHHVTITTTGPTPRPPSVDEDKMSTDSVVVMDQDPMTQSVYDGRSSSPTEFEHHYEDDRTSETAWSVKSGADSEANNNNDDEKETTSLTKTSHNGNVLEHQSVMDESEHTNNVSSL